MKEFIYLNTDYINSMLAQFNDGLPATSGSEESRGMQKAKAETTATASHKRGMSIGIPNIATVDTELLPESYEEHRLISSTSFGREMVTRIVHDNSYDMFLNLVDENDYVTLKGTMQVYDLDFLASLIENEFMDLYKLEMPSTQEILNSLNREQRRDKKIKGKLSAIESQNSEDLHNIDYALKALRFLAKVFPSDVYILTDDYFVPLKRKFLREEAMAINYTYTSTTTVMGKPTGTIGELLRYKEDNEFNDMVNSMYDVGLSGMEILGISKELQLLIPISWYSE